MAVTGVLRPGFVQVRVLDLDEAITYYRDRIGLDQVGEVVDGKVYFRAFDEFDRHSVILRQADAAGMAREQLSAHRFLQRLQGCRHRRLRHIAAKCGTRHLPGLRDGHEMLDLLQSRDHRFLRYYCVEIMN